MKPLTNIEYLWNLRYLSLSSAVASERLALDAASLYVVGVV